MPQSSPRLTLPFIQPAQAQKHVTHNEALRRLDIIVQLSVTAFDAVTPPANPDDGESHAIGASATDAWAGHDGDVAFWFDSAWHFVTPSAGWLAVEAGSTDVMVHDGSGWVAASTSVDFDNLPGVGINTTSDATNRLSVSAPATLLTHEGAGHQLKINKSSASDTASLLFQSDWSGRAEIGLAGTDAFSVKLSADGVNWEEALSLAAGSGIVTTANMVGVVAATPGPGNAVIETGDGANGSYTKFADGTLICQIEAFTTADGAAATWTLPETFASAAYSVAATVLGSTPGVITISSQSATDVEIESFDLAGSDSVTPDVSLLAVGRWL